MKLLKDLHTELHTSQAVIRACILKIQLELFELCDEDQKRLAELGLLLSFYVLFASYLHNNAEELCGSSNFTYTSEVQRTPIKGLDKPSREMRTINVCNVDE
jgi:hypothetical protein